MKNNGKNKLHELLKGNSTLIKDKEFLSTKEYVEPFLEKMSKYTDDFRVEVKVDQLSIQGNIINKIYNRVLIQAVLPESYYFEDNHRKVVGMVYGLDVKSPVAKIYTGGLNMACINLTVFSPEYLHVQEIKPETNLQYESIKQVMEMTDELSVMLKKMKSQHIDRDEATEHLGNWVDFTLREVYNPSYGKIKIASSTPIEVYKKFIY